jgi:hypothetical protein
MSLPPSRRTFLAGVGLAGLAGVTGCVDELGSTRGATDVTIHNEAEISRTVELTVTKRGEESSSIDTSLDMDPHSKQKINNEVIMDSNYDVEVTYTDDTGESPYKERQEWNDAGQPLHILLDDQIVFTVQIG